MDQFFWLGVAIGFAVALLLSWRMAYEYRVILHDKAKDGSAIELFGEFFHVVPIDELNALLQKKDL